MRRWLLGSVLSFGIVVTSSAGAAPHAPKTPPPPVDRAELFVKRALEAARKGRFAEALEAGRAAYSIDPGFEIACHNGRAAYRLGLMTEAAEFLSRCRELAPTPTSNDDRALQRAEADELAKAQSRVGAIRLIVSRPGAQVFVDGEMWPGAAPPVLYLDPGPHRITAEEGGDVANAVVESVKGQTTIVALTLAPPKAHAMSPVSHASGVARPSTESTAPQAPGKVDEPVFRPASTPMMVAGIGLSVVGAATAVGGFVAAATKRADVDEMSRSLFDKWGAYPCTEPTHAGCEELEESSSRVPVLTAVGIVGLGITAAGGALLVYELARPKSQKSTQKAHVSISAAPGRGALTIVGTF